LCFYPSPVPCVFTLLLFLVFLPFSCSLCFYPSSVPCVFTLLLFLVFLPFSCSLCFYPSPVPCVFTSMSIRYLIIKVTIFLNFPATISSSISFKFLGPLFQSSSFVSLYLPFFPTLCLCLLPPSYAKPELQVGRSRVRFPMV